MTSEDLAQIRAIVTEAVDAAVQSTAKDLAQLREEMNIRFAETRADARRSLDAAVQSIASDFSQLREEMNGRFDQVNQRFEVIERRLDLTSETMRGIDFRISALSNWADTCDRGTSAILATQAAQQRAIDEIVNRLTRVERELHTDQ